MRTRYAWGKGFSFSTVLRTAGSTAIKENPTISAAADVKISKDGGAFANLATTPSVEPVSATSVRVKVTISNTEAQAKEILIRFKDSASPATWDDQILILSAFDARESRIQYIVPGLIERAGVVSQIIEREVLATVQAPDHYLLYTSDTSASRFNIDPRLLIGSVVCNESSGSQMVILGGYFFDSSDNKTYSVFGIAKDPVKFGITEGSSAWIGSVLYTWGGASSLLDETAGGSGWTFICALAPNTTNSSGNSLEIYIDPSMVAEHQMCDYLDLKRIKIENAYGTAFEAKSTSNNGNGMDLAGHGTGAALKAIGGAVSGHGAYFEGNNSASTDACGIVATAKGASSLSAHGILAETVGQTGHGISAKSENGDGVRGESTYAVGVRAKGAFGVFVEATDHEGVTVNAKLDGIDVNAGTSGGNYIALDLNGSGTGKDIDADEIGHVISMANDVVTASAIAANAIGSSEFAQAAADKVWASATRTLTAISTTLALSVWNVLTSNITTASSIGKKLIDWLAGTDTSTPTVNLTKISGSAVSTSTAQLGVNAVSIANDAITAAAIANDAIGASEIADGAIDAGAIATGAITSAKFAAGAIDANAIATNAIGANELAADAIAEIADGVWDEILSGHSVAGSAGKAITDLGTAVSAVDADTSAIVAKLPSGDIADEASVQTAISDIGTVDGKVDALPDAEDNADAVWDEALAGHSTAGSTGKALSDAVQNIGVPVSVDGSNATLAAMLVKMIDDNGGADFDAATDSLYAQAQAIADTVKLNDTLDGVTISDIYEILLAMANGRYVKNVPSAGYLTYYKRDNTTPIFIVKIDEIGRTRS